MPLSSNQLGFKRTSARLHERLKAGDLAGMAELISDEMLVELTVESTWDELRIASSSATTASPRG